MNPFLRNLSSLSKLQDLKYQYASISLFSGGGGLDLGLAFAGFRTVFASDIEAPLIETINKNFPGCATRVFDVEKLDAKQIHSWVGDDNCDLVTGGPPCQAFSVLGQRNSFHDPRGKLVYDFVRLITEIQPRAFLFENVPGLLTLNGGKDWTDLLEYFKAKTGYK